MPEGHTIHRLAQDYSAAFLRTAPQVTSPQGKFSDAAALLDRAELTHTEAHGKHLFLGFREADWIHIHLGLFGKVNFGPTPAPPPRTRSASAWRTTPRTSTSEAPPPAPSSRTPRSRRYTPAWARTPYARTRTPPRPTPASAAAAQRSPPS